MHLLSNERKANHRFARFFLLLLGLLSLTLTLRHDPGRLPLKPGENEPTRQHPSSQLESKAVIPTTSQNTSRFSPDDATRNGLREAYGEIPLSFERQSAQQ